MKVYKHHISIDFEKDPSLLRNNGVGKGGTIFLDYNKMEHYLSFTGKRWHYVELEMKKYEFVLINDFMATSLVRKVSKNDFQPLV